MAAFICVVLSLTIVETILLQGSDRLYTPASWFLISGAALVMSSIAIASGWVAATSFALTYIFASLAILLLTESIYSLETLFIPVLGSLVLLAELLFIIVPAQYLFSAFSSGIY
jgi:hypothetical protein